jgi:hypothetical protein
MDAMSKKSFTVTKCNHVFHKKCIKKWTTNFNTTCHLCRAQIVPKQDVIYKTTIEEEAFIISLLLEFRSITAASSITASS